ncbi:MAG: NAD(P)H-dependent oxidoreductase [Clostridiaceae bacterium]|jgi:multimeric flavodoxin WrbA|nr:NAD(P)H-dependent oxidoreductase [Clostridiaceae bacterium]
MNKYNIMLLCASPRRKGTSAMLLERVRNLTGGDVVFLPQKDSLEEFAMTMKQAETIVISGPCYINTYPARLIELLETASRSGGFSGQKLYGIINGGMPYIHTHRHGLTTLQLFAEQNHLSWQGGFVLGGGAMLDGKPLENHMSRKKVVPAFNQFIRHIAEGSSSLDSLYEQAQTPPGRFVTRIFSKFLTSMVLKNLKKHGHDPNAPNWYLRQQG